MLEASFLSNSQPEMYFKTSILSPEFSSTQKIWIKNSLIQFPTGDDCAKFKFYKIGKTFGIYTKRTLIIKNHIMVYYENSSDKEIKGHCSLRNLYVGFFIVDAKYKYLVQFTNFKHNICMYFENKNDIMNLKQIISKYVVQLRFNSKFQTIGGLGEGSFAKVLLANKKHGETGQPYAVKVISKIDKNNNSATEPVKHQKSILESLNSEYVCKLYEFYEDTNNFYIVLEYAAGKTLMDLFRQNYQFSSSNKQYILKQILQGLLYLHSQKIIHRDLKPQNIMIKIIDFGLSLVLRPDLDIKSFKRCGTMGYIAPEIISNTSKSRKAYGCKTDIFSFGIIAHMLLMGSNPLKGKTYQQTTQLNKTMGFVLKRSQISNRYGQNCVKFLQGCLKTDQYVRLSAGQALNQCFLKQKLITQNLKSVFEEKQIQILNVYEEQEEENREHKAIKKNIQYDFQYS